MKLSFGIVFAFVLILSGCGPVVEIDLDQTLKDYVAYSPGSYWIYRDSANNLNKDSVIILTNTYKIVEGGEKPTKVQHISTRYYSSKDNIYLIDGVTVQYGDEDIPDYGDYGYMDTMASINYCFLSPGSSGDYQFSLSTLGTYKVRNKVYQDVIKFTVPRFNKTVFWSRHVGVIKSIYRGITWELDTCVVKDNGVKNSW